MKEPQLPRIHQPSDLRGLSYTQLNELAKEIRAELIRVVSVNGGHLASNLGVVELTIALHRVFDVPKDKIMWDVSHQCYVHKILTGRREAFETLRQHGGMELLLERGGDVQRPGRRGPDRHHDGGNERPALPGVDRRRADHALSGQLHGAQHERRRPAGRAAQ